MHPRGKTNATLEDNSSREFHVGLVRDSIVSLKALANTCVLALFFPPCYHLVTFSMIQITTLNRHNKLYNFLSELLNDIDCN